MAVLGYFLLGIARVLDFLLNVYLFILLGAAIVSWVNADPYNPIVRFLRDATEPVIVRVRRYVPPIGVFDLAFIVVLAAVYFLQTFLVGLLAHYASQFNG
jgi:YggT family protein